MPRYMVERSFPDRLTIPLNAQGVSACRAVVDTNADEGVIWLHSYVSDDNARTCCIYDAPDPEAIRRSAERNHLPVDRITEVRVLDPYFYRP